MNLTEKTKSQEYIFEGRIINLRRDIAILPDGCEAPREVVEHNGGVCVLPLTADNEIIFVKQFRYPYMTELLEIPAGKRDSKDEDPLHCGKRELKEETGAESDNFVFLGELYPSPGYVNEVIYMYYADNLKYGDANPDDDEFLDLIKISFDKAVEMVVNGEIKDAKTQAAILKVAHLKANNRI